MAVDTLERLTVEGYLEQERRAETKSEYLDGEVFAMSGASRAHSLIVTNLVAALHGASAAAVARSTRAVYEGALG